MTHEVSIYAGPHERRHCPLRFALPEGVGEGPWELVSEDGHLLPLQCSGSDAACILPAMETGSTRTYLLQSAEQHEARDAVTLREEGDGLTVHIGGDLLTRYVYQDVPARPYFYPLLAPGQIAVTRAYPMRTDVEGETHDHPHHRSLWIAFGEVNDADNWSEGPGHAATRHLAFEKIESGPVCGRFATRSAWISNQDETLLTQRLEVTVWAVNDGLRLLDFEIDLTAAKADVHFGDTKEGGILSVRVASELDVPKTGRITNVYGGINEAETWGKSAHWCDYSGRAGGESVGIAVLDHPHSFRYPTHWHVRDYGLMTTNPFAYAAFTGGLKNGSHTLPAGQTLSFRYRILLHTGDCDSADIRARYLDYVAPPVVNIAP